MSEIYEFGVFRHLLIHFRNEGNLKKASCHKKGEPNLKSINIAKTKRALSLNIPVHEFM